ncbi:hypothetical protein SNEBB_011443 [Seison nebaliae]|nr:hypothetical protein SNEBB_011443 [Seison nebaliae]
MFILETDTLLQLEKNFYQNYNFCKATSICLSKTFLAIGNSLGNCQLIDCNNGKCLAITDNYEFPVKTIKVSEKEQYLFLLYENNRYNIYSIGSDEHSSETKLNFQNTRIVNTLNTVQLHDNGYFIYGTSAGNIYAQLINRHSSGYCLFQLNAPIVQLELINENLLLIATTEKSYIGTYNLQQSNVRLGCSCVQIGSKERHGYYGITSAVIKSENTIFCSRPKSRLWKANMFGEVIETIKMKNVQCYPSKTTEDEMEPNDFIIKNLSFGRLILIEQSILINWTNEEIYFLQLDHDFYTIHIDFGSLTIINVQFVEYWRIVEIILFDNQTESFIFKHYRICSNQFEFYLNQWYTNHFQLYHSISCELFNEDKIFSIIFLHSKKPNEIYDFLLEHFNFTREQEIVLSNQSNYVKYILFDYIIRMIKKYEISNRLPWKRNMINRSISSSRLCRSDDQEEVVDEFNSFMNLWDSTWRIPPVDLFRNFDGKILISINIQIGELYDQYTINKPARFSYLMKLKYFNNPIEYRSTDHEDVKGFNDRLSKFFEEIYQFIKNGIQSENIEEIFIEIHEKLFLKTESVSENENDVDFGLLFTDKLCDLMKYFCALNLHKPKYTDEEAYSNIIFRVICLSFIYNHRFHDCFLMSSFINDDRFIQEFIKTIFLVIFHQNTEEFSESQNVSKLNLLNSIDGCFEKKCGKNIGLIMDFVEETLNKSLWQFSRLSVIIITIVIWMRECLPSINDVEYFYCTRLINKMLTTTITGEKIFYQTSDYRTTYLSDTVLKNFFRHLCGNLYINEMDEVRLAQFTKWISQSQTHRRSREEDVIGKELVLEDRVKKGNLSLPHFPFLDNVLPCPTTDKKIASGSKLSNDEFIQFIHFNHINKDGLNRYDIVVNEFRLLKLAQLFYANKWNNNVKEKIKELIEKHLTENVTLSDFHYHLKELDNENYIQHDQLHPSLFAILRDFTHIYTTN